MGRALILLGLLSLAALLVAFGVGLFFRFGVVGIATHIMLSVPGVLLTMFTQIMVIMYFTGTGSRVRKAVKAGVPLHEAYDKVRACRKEVMPWAAVSLVLVMATTILAGGVHTGVLPAVVHWGLALLTLGATMMAVYREILAIDLNERVLEEHEDALEPY